jgi:hypothetical protein
MPVARACSSTQVPGEFVGKDALAQAFRDFLVQGEGGYPAGVHGGVTCLLMRGFSYCIHNYG